MNIKYRKIKQEIKETTFKIGYFLWTCLIYIELLQIY